MVILKDVHITEAAIYLDVAVFSFDDTQRRVLAELYPHYSRLGAIQWFNPERDAESSTSWLQSEGHDMNTGRISKFNGK
ncbi:Hypothetical protein AJAP_30560 [Amycolatopsis japonica]|uniref:Uncharacterized protein n=1 Tax=Amycolatopsis japonica TaxID=208439 RepID=A0A075V2Y9_9PSEU|nr:Hypothetical protein AJAP_30560 [Amycolatopsis japonica]